MTLNRARVGDGDREAVLWLEDHFQAVTGLDRLPDIVDEYVIQGERWRVVEFTDRVVCEKLTN